MSDDFSADPTSVVEIMRRQQELEILLQSIPELQKQADDEVVAAEEDWKLAEARQLGDLALNPPYKMTVAERDAIVFQREKDKWKRLQVAKTAAKYQKSRADMAESVLTSLASRLKHTANSGNAHARWGQG